MLFAQWRNQSDRSPPQESQSKYLYILCQNEDNLAVVLWYHKMQLVSATAELDIWSDDCWASHIEFMGFPCAILPEPQNQHWFHTIQPTWTHISMIMSETHKVPSTYMTCHCNFTLFAARVDGFLFLSWVDIFPNVERYFPQRDSAKGVGASSFSQI